MRLFFLSINVVRDEKSDFFLKTMHLIKTTHPNQEVPDRTVKGKKVNLPDTFHTPKVGLFRPSNLILKRFRHLNIVRKGELCITKGSSKYKKGPWLTN